MAGYVNSFRLQYEQVTWGQLHGQRPQKGFRQKGSREAWKTRLAPMGAAEARRIPKGGLGQGTSDCVDGKCERAPAQG